MIVLIPFAAVGCSRTDDVESTVATQEGEYTIYYPDDDMSRLYSYVYCSDTTDSSKLISELFGQLKKGDYEGARNPVISDSMGEISSKLDYRGLLSVYFTAAYQTLEDIEEVLFRAAVVKTLCQARAVKGVEFYVNNEPLVIQNGQVIIGSLTESAEDNANSVYTDTVGIMNGYDFVNNIGNGDAYEQEDILTLYFADESGTLLETSFVHVKYDSTISMEELVVLQLISGPVSEGCYQTVNKDTSINKITIKDNICYLDLSEDFLSFPKNVTKEVAVYSIVNSLIDLSTVSKVQIFINGEVLTDYADDGLLDRNYDIIDEQEE